MKHNSNNFGFNQEPMLTFHEVMQQKHAKRPHDNGNNKGSLFTPLKNGDDSNKSKNVLGIGKANSLVDNLYSADKQAGPGSSSSNK